MRARAYFDAYCALGTTRALSKLATFPIDGKTVTKRTLEEWSRLFNWVKRAEAYDKEQLERKRKIRQGRLDKLYDELADFAEKERVNTLKDIEKLRKSKNGLSAVAAVQYMKLLIETHLHVLGDDDKQKIEITGKDDGPLEITVETFWGRGTDPRRKAPEDTAQAETSGEDPESDTDFDIDVDEDAWDDSDEE